MYIHWETRTIQLCAVDAGVNVLPPILPVRGARDIETFPSTREMDAHTRYSTGTVLQAKCRQQQTAEDVMQPMKYAHREQQMILRTSQKPHHPLFNPTDFPTGTLANCTNYWRARNVAPVHASRMHKARLEAC